MTVALGAKPPSNISSQPNNLRQAYEIPARRVMKREELQDAIHEMLANDGPFLLEACVIEEGNRCV